MDATITTIGDVFNKKVDDIITESYDAPTIWVDSITGEEHEDYVNTHIESKDPNSYVWMAGKNESCYVVSRADEPVVLVVNGPIKQVGSHVIECGPLFDMCDEDSHKDYPFLDQLDKVFKYARNLESCFNLFNFWKPNGGFTIPENLFWNCPKLKEIFNIFYETNLREIPPRLLERCLNLESVECMFYETEVEEIPEDLFKNNLKIKKFDSIFAYTRVKKIPYKLLEPFKDGILNKEITVDEFVTWTPLKDKITYMDDSLSQQEKEAIRDQCIPSYLTGEVRLDLLGLPRGGDSSDSDCLILI